MRAFNFFSPKTIEEAYALLEEYKDDYALIAGGTDITIALNDRECKKGNIVDLTKIPSLRGISERDGRLHVGATTTFTDIENNEFIKNHVKALHSAAAGVGSPQIRNLGTIGGNLCNASVAGDSLNAFTLLDSDVVLGSIRGIRTMKLSEFYKDPKKTQLEPGEIMLETVTEIPDDHTATAYAKLGRRKALAILVLGVGAYIKLDGDKIADAHFTVGAVARYPVRVPKIEAAVKGETVSRQLLYEQLPAFTETIKELIPTRASVGYKSEAARGMASIAIDHVLDDLGIV